METITETRGTGMSVRRSNMTFSRAGAVASVFSLSIHAIVLLVLFYRFGAYLHIIDLPQIQTVSLILSMPQEKPRPAAPVRVAQEKKAIPRKMKQHEEARTAIVPVKELASEKEEEKTASPSINGRLDKKTSQSMEVQAEDAEVALPSKEDKRAGDIHIGAPAASSSGHEGVKAAVVSSSGQGETLVFPVATRGLFVGSAAKGKTGEGDSLSRTAGKGKAAEGEKVIPGNAPVNTSGEGASFRASTGGETSSGGGLVVAAPRYGENSPPAYPLLARRRGYAGVVMLSVEVLTDGTVGHIAVKKTSGYDLLDRSAFEAVKGWKFVPAKKAGLPIIMRVDVPVRFSLN